MVLFLQITNFLRNELGRSCFFRMCVNSCGDQNLRNILLDLFDIFLKDIIIQQQNFLIFLHLLLYEQS